jgi:hypothetical protein
MLEARGTYHNHNDESTAFTSLASRIKIFIRLPRTTATHPNQRDSDSSSNQCSFPSKVVLCGEIRNLDLKYEEMTAL